MQEAEKELEEVTVLLGQSLAIADASLAKPRKTVPITEVGTHGSDDACEGVCLVAIVTRALLQLSLSLSLVSD